MYIYSVQVESRWEVLCPNDAGHAEHLRDTGKCPVLEIQGLRILRVQLFNKSNVILFLVNGSFGQEEFED